MRLFLGLLIHGDLNNWDGVWKLVIDETHVWLTEWCGELKGFTVQWAESERQNEEDQVSS
jgi:hypothetical protein